MFAFRIFAVLLAIYKSKKSRFYLITPKTINPIFLILFADSEAIHTRFLCAFFIRRLRMVTL